MNQQTHLWPREPKNRDGVVEIGAVIERPGRAREELWYRLPSEYRPRVTESANPFALAMLFAAMREHGDLRIHGRVSPSLLRNLEEAQRAWICWQPLRYGLIEVHVDDEREEDASESDAALMAFSGGLDSSFTAWRHKQGSCGRRNRKIEAGLMAHGFDIPLDQPEVFARAADNSRRLLDSIGMELIPVSCNARELNGHWEETHGSAIGSCLHLLSRRYSAGLIAGSHSYGTLRFPWGSNPVTDPMLGSRTFSIVYDGGEYRRNEKAKGVAAWTETSRRLRVCWEGKQKDKNCGTCLRCVGTVLCFAAERLAPPESIPVRSLDESIRGLNWPHMKSVGVARLDELLSVARSSGITDSWVDVLDQCIDQARRRERGRWIRRWIKGKVVSLGRPLRSV